MFVVADVLYIPDFFRTTTQWKTESGGWKAGSGKSISGSAIKSLSQSPLKSVGITGLCSHFSHLFKREWILVIKTEWNDILYWFCTVLFFFFSQWGRERLYWWKNLSSHISMAGSVTPRGLQAYAETTRWQNPLGNRLVRSA